MKQKEQIRRDIGLSVTDAQVACSGRKAPAAWTRMHGASSGSRANFARSAFFPQPWNRDLTSSAIPVVMLGGGATVVKSCEPPRTACVGFLPLPDDKVNAKGFERIFGAVCGPFGQQMSRPLFGFRPNLPGTAHRRAWKILQAVPEGRKNAFWCRQFWSMKKRKLWNLLCGGCCGRTSICSFPARTAAGRSDPTGDALQ